MGENDYKKELIEMVNRLGSNDDFWKEEGNYKKDKKPGASNIVSIANICENADCYQEVKLFIEYKIAKGNGWDTTFEGNKKFGEVVIEDMDKIYEEVNRDDKEALKRISLYFGYLYWKKSYIEKVKNKGGK